MKPSTIQKHFGKIPDPRAANSLHLLIDIIAISICAVICGSKTYNQIEEYGKDNYKWLKGFLELPNGIPSHDTFGRMFSVIDPREFQNCFMEWIADVSRLIKRETIAIDGKTLRRSYDSASDKKAIHMISAWATDQNIVLGQYKTAEKSNEITAIPILIKMLDLSGSIVTIDAMGCQKKIASSIIEKKADYVLSLKENQPQLYGDIKLYMDDIILSSKENEAFSYYETIDADHGRIETRKYWITSDIDWLYGKANWRGLKSIGCIERIRETEKGISTEKSYFIGSIESDAELFAKAVRNHWGIENGLHWTLDMAFREDESRIRKGHAPENFAVLRHIALNLIKSETSFKGSVNTKQLKAAWNRRYLEKIIKVI
jgi:predicted transposase YbfD/YdcC